MLAPVGLHQLATAAGSARLSEDHFKTLREVGVIITRREGTQALNTLQEDDLDAAFLGLLDSIVPRRGE